MSAPCDPKWLGLATRLYAATLCLYPAALRRAHGQEMRQVFRDRCREAVDGRRGLAGLFLLELLPDTVASAASAQWNVGIGEPQRRHLLAIAVLGLSLLWLLFQDSLSDRLLGVTYRTQNTYYTVRAARILAREEQQVRGLADVLARDPSPAAKAQAAYLYRSLYGARMRYSYSAATQDAEGAILAARAIDGTEGDLGLIRGVLADDGDRATAALDGVVDPAQQGWVAAARAFACLPQAGCNRALQLARLTAIEPDNGYGWSLEFRRAIGAHDDFSAGAALSRIAAARYYDDHLGRIRREILSSSLARMPSDAEARAAVAMRVADVSALGTEDFADDVRRQCSLRDRGALRPSWAKAHPESGSDCLRVARLLTHSTSRFDVWRGWALLAERDPSPEVQSAFERAQQAYLQNGTGIGYTRKGEGNVWKPWSTAQWNDWAKTIASGADPS